MGSHIISSSTWALKILCPIADRIEIQPLLSQCLQRSQNYYIWRQNQIEAHCIITGWGSQSVATALQEAHLVQSSWDLVWNMGFAGSANRNYPLHHLFAIHQVTHLNCHHTLPIAPWPMHYPIASLHTADCPYREGLSDTIQLVDMEGFEIASWAAQHNFPLIMHKIVSDFTIPRGSGYLRAHMNELAHTLSQSFLALLSNKEQLLQLLDCMKMS